MKYLFIHNKAVLSSGITGPKTSIVWYTLSGQTNVLITMELTGERGTKNL